MPTIWDTARLWAGQNNTTVEYELSRLQKRSVAVRRRKAQARKRVAAQKPATPYNNPWARGEVTQTRLPYAD